MSDVGSIQAVGGMFLVDGKAMDLGQLMLMLNIDRTQGIGEVVAGQMTEVQDKNKQLKALNALMAKCREYKADKSSAHDDNTMGDQFKLPGYEDKGNKTVAGWFAEFGLTETDVNPGDDKDEWNSEWDANIQTLKGAVDSVNSESQLLTTSLSANMNKLANSTEMTSSMVQKNQALIEKVLQALGR